MTMGDVTVFYGEDAQATAILLLGTAEGLALGQEVVRTIQGAFIVPSEVADAAGLGESTQDEQAAEKPADKTKPAESPPAKKTAAKRTPAKKATAKKTAAKKTTAKKTQE